MYHHWQHATVTCQVRTRSAFYDRTSNAPHLLLQLVFFKYYKLRYATFPAIISNTTQ